MLGAKNTIRIYSEVLVAFVLIRTHVVRFAAISCIGRPSSTQSGRQQTNSPKTSPSGSNLGRKWPTSGQMWLRSAKVVVGLGRVCLGGGSMDSVQDVDRGEHHAVGPTFGQPESRWQVRSGWHASANARRYVDSKGGDAMFQRCSELFGISFSFPPTLLACSKYIPQWPHFEKCCSIAAISRKSLPMLANIGVNPANIGSKLWSHSAKVGQSWPSSGRN